MIVNELAKIYNALKLAVDPGLEIPASFREYALAAQNSAAADKALAYWRRQFDASPPPLDLPSDRPRPSVRSARAATLTREIGAPLQQSLKRVAAQNRTTLVVLLLAGLKTLLHRLSGQTDVVVGLAAAGQAITGKTCLVGHCVNLLPIRSQLLPEAPFHENLAVVKNAVLDAYDHSQCTIGTILQHLKVARTASRPPLVEVIFNIDRDPGSEQFADLELTCDRNPKRALHFDFFFNVVERSQGLCIECDYNTDLFDAPTISRWLENLQVLLEQVVAAPSRTLSSLPVLTAVELEELVIHRNQTGREVPLLRVHRAL